VTTDNWDGGVLFGKDPVEAMKTHKDVISDPERLAALRKEVKVDQPFPMAPIAIQPATEAFDEVVTHAGATLPRRDTVDTRILGEVRTGKVTYEAGKGIISDISQIGGFPEYKGAPFAGLGSDGIPLWWKNKYKLDAQDPDLASKDLQGDGYTVIEKFLNGLDPTKRIEWQSPQSNENTLTSETFAPGKS